MKLDEVGATVGWEYVRAREGYYSMEAVMVSLGYIRYAHSDFKVTLELGDQTLELNESGLRRFWRYGGFDDFLNWRAIRHEFLFLNNEFLVMDGKETRNQEADVLRITQPQLFSFSRYLEKRLVVLFAWIFSDPRGGGWSRVGCWLPEPLNICSRLYRNQFCNKRAILL